MSSTRRSILKGLLLAPFAPLLAKLRPPKEIVFYEVWLPPEEQSCCWAGAPGCQEQGDHMHWTDQEIKLNSFDENGFTITREHPFGAVCPYDPPWARPGTNPNVIVRGRSDGA